MRQNHGGAESWGRLEFGGVVATVVRGWAWEESKTPSTNIQHPEKLQYPSFSGWGRLTQRTQSGKLHPNVGRKIEGRKIGSRKSNGTAFNAETAEAPEQRREAKIIGRLTQRKRRTRSGGETAKNTEHAKGRQEN